MNLWEQDVNELFRKDSISIKPQIAKVNFNFFGIELSTAAFAYSFAERFLCHRLVDCFFGNSFISDKTGFAHSRNTKRNFFTLNNAEIKLNGDKRSFFFINLWFKSTFID